MDDVGLGEGRIGGVLGLHLVRRPAEPHADVVLLDGGGDGHVDVRLRAGGIDELNGSAVEDEAIVVEDDISSGEIDPAEDDRVVRGASDLEVGGTVHADRAADEVDVVCGVDSQVEVNVLRNAADGGGCGCPAGELPDEGGELERRGERDVGEVDGAAEEGVVGGAGEVDIGVDGFAHALGIEQADVFGRHAEVELEGWPVSHASGSGDFAAADGPGEALNVDAVGGELQDAVAVLQAYGEVSRSVIKVDE